MKKPYYLMTWIVCIYLLTILCDRRDSISKLPMQSVSITTKVVSSNPTHDEVYSIQHDVFVSDLPQVGGFLRVLHFSPPIMLTATI